MKAINKIYAFTKKKTVQYTSLVFGLVICIYVFVPVSFWLDNIGDKKYHSSVAPFLKLDANCKILFSDSRVLSEQSTYKKLSYKEANKKFNIKLLCDDLMKSYKETKDFHNSNNLIVDSPEATPIQNHRDALVIHKIDPKVGYTISTIKPLRGNTIIAEYIGERRKQVTKKVQYDFLTKVTGVKFKDPDANFDTSYTFATNVPDSYWMNSSRQPVVETKNFDINAVYIDSKKYGNIARFFHHCPSSSKVNPGFMTANIDVLVWPVSTTVAKVFLVTKRDIDVFEPLCFDYGSSYFFEGGVSLLDQDTFLPINIK